MESMLERMLSDVGEDVVVHVELGGLDFDMFWS